MRGDARNSWTGRLLVWANTDGSAVTLAGIVAIVAGLLVAAFGEAALAEGAAAVAGGLAAVWIGRRLGEAG